jgi:antitoxin (DNA-binding transcriptional repressor) of toxin-antitoxin stability system
MKIISIRELHEKTGDWVRRSVTLGPIAVTYRGKVIAQMVPVEASVATNPFSARKLRKGYARLLGKLNGSTDSTRSVSEDRDAK